MILMRFCSGFFPRVLAGLVPWVAGGLTPSASFDLGDAADSINPAVFQALALITGATFRAFSERHAIGELKDCTLGEVFDGDHGFVLGVGIVAFHHLDEVLVSCGTRLDVSEMVLQSFDDIFRENLGLQVGKKQPGKRLPPFVTMGFHTFLGMAHINGVMGKLVDEGDQHLIRVEVQI